MDSAVQDGQQHIEHLAKGVTAGHRRGRLHERACAETERGSAQIRNSGLVLLTVRPSPHGCGAPGRAADLTRSAQQARAKNPRPSSPPPIYFRRSESALL